MSGYGSSLYGGKEYGVDPLIHATAAIADGTDSPVFTGALAAVGTAALTDSLDVSASTGWLSIGAAVNVTDAGDTVASTSSVAEINTGFGVLVDQSDAATVAAALTLAAFAPINDGDDVTASTGTMPFVRSGDSAINDGNDALASTAAAVSSLTGYGASLYGVGRYSDGLDRAANVAVTDATDAITASATSIVIRLASAFLDDEADTVVATSGLVAMSGYGAGQYGVSRYSDGIAGAADAAINDGNDAISATAIAVPDVVGGYGSNLYGVSRYSDGTTINASAAITDSADLVVASAISFISGAIGDIADETDVVVSTSMVRGSAVRVVDEDDAVSSASFVAFFWSHLPDDGAEDWTPLPPASNNWIPLAANDTGNWTPLAAAVS